MITATVYRTNQQEIDQAGQALAFGPMNFNPTHTSEAAIRDYCERLAKNDDIAAPRIVISTGA